MVLLNMETKKQLEERINKKDLALRQLHNDNYTQRKKIEELEREITHHKGISERREYDLEVFRKDRNLFTTIMLGEAKPESKVEVLKDLFNLNKSEKVFL